MFGLDVDPQGYSTGLSVKLEVVLPYLGKTYSRPVLDDTDERTTDRRVPLVTPVPNGAPLFDDSPMGLYDYMIDHWNCRPL